MRIAIAERLRPFSHLPGSRCVLPFSKWGCEIFPTLVRMIDLEASEPRLVASWPLELLGPIDNFTVIQDLEKGYVRFFGHGPDGYFRYRIVADSSPVGYTITRDQKIDAEPMTSAGPIFASAMSLERLSFGCTKAQQWPSIAERRTLSEIFPLWFRLGQQLPPLVAHAHGAASLLLEIEELIARRSLLELEAAWQRLYAVAFGSMLLPQLADPMHLGIPVPAVDNDAKGSPLWLLARGAQLIKRMLVAATAESVAILPALLPSLHAGRLLNVHIEGLGHLDLEWSKKTIRRMIFKSIVDGTVHFTFQSGMRHFRWCEAADLRGRVGQCNIPLQVEAGKCYFFDCFSR
jgi:hypothetical protein